MGTYLDLYLNQEYKIKYMLNLFRTIDQNSTYDCYIFKNDNYVIIKIILIKATYVIPCSNNDSLRVLQIIKSVHCTITIEIKKAVWHVNSKIFLCLKLLKI